MRSYGQYCPIALAAEVFAERWTPIILRNLHLGCHRYAEILDGAPGLPRSVLSTRLRTLARTGVLRRTGTGRRIRYELTDCGRELVDVCFALGAWGARWMHVRPEDQDPYLALWTVARCVDPDSLLPRGRVVVRFDLTDGRPPHRFWLVVDKAGNEVCVDPPGHAEDGVVTTDTASLIRWYAGEVTLGAAQRTGGMTVAAPRWLERELVRWGRFSPYAHVAAG
ncbi:winged helix-turn-helix transcriptional regulator [Virgisporangium aurantiacum]|uniref:Transcriptional regulator n=1 Tax=Virgisporangium aurantiacum TaxID=175570 RepID=A0A8J3ZA14_9ACTN|nr:helix-turn-helix domain-containing protein [Virgisporangium aurantiacum]GIJ60149.1 transcriptional regulator [Virgisporangium aurantiacum]